MSGAVLIEIEVKAMQSLGLRAAAMTDVEAIDTGAAIIASACPFCNTMLTDGVKHGEKEDTVKVMDVAELIAASIV